MVNLNDMPVEVLREIVELLQFSDILKLICTRDKRLHRHLFQPNFIKRLRIDHDSTSERHFQLWLLRALRGIDEIDFLATMKGAQRLIPTLAIKPIKRLRILTPLHDGVQKIGMHEDLVEYFAAVRDPISQTTAPALAHIFPQLESLYVSFDVDALYTVTIPRKNITMWFSRGARAPAGSKMRALALASFFSALPPRLQILTLDFTQKHTQLLFVHSNAFEELPQYLTKLVLKSNFNDYSGRLHLAVFGQCAPNLEILEVHMPYSTTGISAQDDALPPKEDKTPICPFPPNLLRLSLVTTSVSTNTQMASFPRTLQTLELIGDDLAPHRLVFGPSALFEPILPPSLTDLSMKGLYLAIGGAVEWLDLNSKKDLALVILPTPLRRLHCARRDFMSTALTTCFPRLCHVTHVSIDEGHRDPQIKSFGTITWTHLTSLQSIELSTRKLRAKHVPFLPPTLKWLKADVENLKTLLLLVKALPHCRFGKMQFELSADDLTLAYCEREMQRSPEDYMAEPNYFTQLASMRRHPELTPLHLLRCFSWLLDRRCQVTLRFPEETGEFVRSLMVFPEGFHGWQRHKAANLAIVDYPTLTVVTPSSVVQTPGVVDTVRFDQPYICSNGLIKLNTSELNPAYFLLPSLTTLKYRSLFPLHSEIIAALPRGLQVFNAMDTPICPTLDLTNLPTSLISFTALYEPVTPEKKLRADTSSHGIPNQGEAKDPTQPHAQGPLDSTPTHARGRVYKSPVRSSWSRLNASSEIEAVGVKAMLNGPVKTSLVSFEAPFLLIDLSDVAFWFPSTLKNLHISAAAFTSDLQVSTLKQHLQPDAVWTLRGIISVSGALVPKENACVDSFDLVNSAQQQLDPYALHLNEVTWKLDSSLRFPLHVHKVSLSQEALEEAAKKCTVDYLHSKMPFIYGLALETCEYRTSVSMTLTDAFGACPSNLKELVLDAMITGTWATNIPKTLTTLDLNSQDGKKPLTIDIQNVPTTISSLRLRSNLKLTPPTSTHWKGSMTELQFEGGAPWTDGFVHELISQLPPGARIKVGTVGFTGVLADRNAKHLDWKVLLKSTNAALSQARITAYDFALTVGIPFYLTPLTSLRSLHLKPKDMDLSRPENADFPDLAESSIIGVDAIALKRFPVLPDNLMELEIENNDEYFPNHSLLDLPMLPTCQIRRLVLNVPLKINGPLGSELPLNLVTLSLPKAKATTDLLDLEQFPKGLQYLSMPRIHLSFEAVAHLPDVLALCVIANPDAVFLSLKRQRPLLSQRLEEALVRRAAQQEAANSPQQPAQQTPHSNPRIRPHPSSFSSSVGSNKQTVSPQGPLQFGEDTSLSSSTQGFDTQPWSSSQASSMSQRSLSSSQRMDPQKTPSKLPGQSNSMDLDAVEAAEQATNLLLHQEFDAPAKQQVVIDLCSDEED